jgi:hypothetical protein
LYAKSFFLCFWPNHLKDDLIFLWIASTIPKTISIYLLLKIYFSFQKGLFFRNKNYLFFVWRRYFSNKAILDYLKASNLTQSAEAFQKETEIEELDPKKSGNGFINFHDRTNKLFLLFDKIVVNFPIIYFLQDYWRKNGLRLSDFRKR